MSDKTIKIAPAGDGRATQNVEIGGRTIGLLTPSAGPHTGGWDVTMTFGPDIPEGVDDEITLSVPTLSLARPLALGLAVVGRQQDYTDMSELPDESGFVLTDRAGAVPAVEGRIPNPETGEFFATIVAGVLAALREHEEVQRALDEAAGKDAAFWIESATLDEDRDDEDGIDLESFEGVSVSVSGTQVFEGVTIQAGVGDATCSLDTREGVVRASIGNIGLLRSADTAVRREVEEHFVSLVEESMPYVKVLYPL